jgi:hypothetical protein
MKKWIFRICVLILAYVLCNLILWELEGQQDTSDDLMLIPFVITTSVIK